MMKVTALVMAGGKGERFWPKSRLKCPKQFLDITGSGRTMLQLTIERILPLIDIKDVYVVTNERYKKLVKKQVESIPEENIICEPAGRNTAPCIGLGAIHILHKNEDAIMVVLASDHMIKGEVTFRDTLKKAIAIAAEKKNMVTIGILPTAPETGYGYIKRNNKIRKETAAAVEAFVEKPDRYSAERYIETGEYLWNSGMFVWKASTIMDAFKIYMPDIYEDLEKIRSSLGSPQERGMIQRVFSTIRAESIDYGIMEKAENVFVITGEFGWDDVGSWLAVERLKQYDENQNVMTGNIVSLNTHDCIMETENKLLVTIGIENLVVVDTKDITFIAEKAHMSDIKTVLEKIKKSTGNEDYL